MLTSILRLRWTQLQSVFFFFSDDSETDGAQSLFDFSLALLQLAVTCCVDTKQFSSAKRETAACDFGQFPDHST